MAGLSKSWYRLPLFVFGFSLLLYLLTLNKYLLLGDSGEFVTAAFTKGVPHSPGYPLYTILGYLISKVPIGNPIQRIGFISAFFGASASSILSCLLLLVTRSTKAALVGSLSLSFSFVFWLYAINPEIITLASAIYLAMFLFGYLYSTTKKNVHLYLLALFTGLGLSNQVTVLAIVPSLLFLLFPYWKNILTWKNLLFLLGFFLLGLVPYLYIPLAASANPYINWDNVNSLSSFIRLVTRADYGIHLGVYLAGSLADILFSQLPYYFYSIFRSIPLILLPLFLLGLWVKKAERIHKTFLIAFMCIGPLLIGYSNLSLKSDFYDQIINQKRTIEAIYVLSFPFVAALIGMGFAKLKGRLNTFLVVVIIVIWALILNLGRIQKSRNDLANLYGNIVLENLPENSILLTGLDDTFIFSYLHAVEQKRPDVAIINFSMLQLPWYSQQVKAKYPDITFPFDYVILGTKLDDFYNANLQKRRIFFAPIDDQILAGISDKFNFIPRNLSVELNKAGQTHDMEEYISERETFFDKLKHSPHLFVDYYDYPSIETKIVYARSLINSGLFLANIGKRNLATSHFQLAKDISEGYYNFAKRNIDNSLRK